MQVISERMIFSGECSNTARYFLHMRRLIDFRNIHAGKAIYVCGLGPSIEGFDPGWEISIGVNDICRYFCPQYLICVNSHTSFTSERWQYIERAGSAYIFTDRNLKVFNPNIVKFRLGLYAGVEWTDYDSLPYTENSPYLALALAVFMGAKRIGLIGVDFVDHPNFDSQRTNEAQAQYQRFYDAYKDSVEMFNLSPVSALTAFPKITVEEFRKR